MMAISKPLLYVLNEIIFQLGMLQMRMESSFSTQHISEAQIATNIHFRR